MAIRDFYKIIICIYFLYQIKKLNIYNLNYVSWNITGRELRWLSKWSFATWLKNYQQTHSTAHLGKLLTMQEMSASNPAHLLCDFNSKHSIFPLRPPLINQMRLVILQQNGFLKCDFEEIGKCNTTGFQTSVLRNDCFIDSSIENVILLQKAADL